jgi:tryptophanyl-tRNA synthetase
VTGQSKRKRVLSGMRPTGRLHIGHYFGALENWVRLQNDPAYDCFYFVADWHSLTSDYADTSQISQNVIEIGIDYLACGLDPAKSTLFIQSQVPEHAELHLLLSMITPLGWLERVPTYKEALENVKNKDLHTYGFLGYPVLQTADIVIYGEPEQELLVPVDEDQVAHVEMGREIVRRFNDVYGLAFGDILREKAWQVQKLCQALEISSARFPTNVFPLNDELWSELRSQLHARIREFGIENGLRRVGLAFVADERDAKILNVRPEIVAAVYKAMVLREADAMLTVTPRIPGTDGRKMSKSYGNAIKLSESDEGIWEKVRPMVTDPARKRRTDPGNPDICPVYDWHKLFSPPETLAWSNHGCRTAEIGCIECKRAMADNLVKWIAPVRERRKTYEDKPGEVLEILREGSKRARNTAIATMERVREAVFGWKAKTAEMQKPAAAKS